MGAKYEVCFYIDGKLALVGYHETRDAAEFSVMDESKNRPEGFEVSIYYRGRALRGWYRKWILRRLPA